MHGAASFDAECSKAASYDSGIMTILSSAIRPRMPIFSPRAQIKIARWGADTEFALWSSAELQSVISYERCAETLISLTDSIFQLGNTLRVMDFRILIALRKQA